MSATSAISPSALAGSKPATRGFNDLKSEDFFKLLIAQLQSQDPLKPTDNQQLLAQISSIRQIEQSSSLNHALTSLAGEQRFGATSGLIGHYVTGTVTNTAGSSEEIAGVVTAVRFKRDGSALLELHDGRVLPAEKVETVTLVENLPPDILAGLQQELGEDGDAPPSPAAAAKVKAALQATQPEPSLIEKLFAPLAGEPEAT